MRFVEVWYAYTVPDAEGKAKGAHGVRVSAFYRRKADVPIPPNDRWSVFAVAQCVLLEHGGQFYSLDPVMEKDGPLPREEPPTERRAILPAVKTTF